MRSRAKKLKQIQKASREALQESSLMIYKRCRNLGDTHEMAIKAIVNHCYFAPFEVQKTNLAR